MKPLILAALVALSAPAALAANTPQQTASDAATASLPDEVKTYVKHHAGEPFPYDGSEIRVGRKLDAGGVWLPIPDHPEYRYSNLSGQLVVIDAKTSKVVALL